MILKKNSAFKIPIFYICIITFLFQYNYIDAQEDSIDYNNLVSIPLKDLLKIKVTGVSKYEETPINAPANVIVVTKEQIKANCYQDLSDLLKNVTGIDLVDNARGYGEYYIFRGIEGNDRFLVLIDGEKINPVSGTFLSIGNSISLNFAERVEIIFGPASVMYGADAFAGIINIITKNPKDNLYVSAKSDYGSLNSFSADFSAIYKPSKNLSISLFARHFQSNGPDFTYRDSLYMQILEYQPPLKNKFEQPINDHTYLIKGNYKNFTLTYFSQRFNEGNAFGQNQKRNVYNADCKWALNNNILRATYNKEFSDKSALNFSVAYVNHTQDPESQFMKINTSVVPYQPFSQYLTGIDNSIRSQIIYTKDFFTKIKLVSGLEYEFSKSIPPYANDQILGRSVKFEGENAEIITQFLTIQEQKMGGFAQISYSMFKKLNIGLGGRYDFSKRYKSTFNPRISVIYSPEKNTSIKLLYGTAFQAPSLFYQYEQWGAAVAVMLSVDEIKKTEPNWYIDNQIVKTSEISAYKIINKKISINISAYHSNLENLIERTTYTDAAFNKYFSTQDTSVYSLGFRNENIGKQKINGLDLRTEFSISNNLYTNFSYSFLNAYSEKTTGNEDIPRIAMHKLWLGFIYQDIFKYFTISARLKLIGDINNRNKTAFPTGKQPGYFNADVSLIVKNMVKPLIFYVRVENIFNTEYNHGGMVDQIVYLPVSAQPGIIIRGGIEIILEKL